MEEDKEMLSGIFKDETNTNTLLTITSISNKLTNSSGLHVLASNKTVKQAINNLHYKQAKHTKTSMNILKTQPVQKEDHVEEWQNDS